MRKIAMGFVLAALVLAAGCGGNNPYVDNPDARHDNLKIYRGKDVPQEQFDAAVGRFKAGWDSFYSALTVTEKNKADKIIRVVIDNSAPDYGYGAFDDGTYTIRFNYALPAAAYADALSYLFNNFIA